MKNYKLTDIGKLNFYYWAKQEKNMKKAVLESGADTNTKDYQLPTVEKIEGTLTQNSWLIFQQEKGVFEMQFHLTDKLTTDILKLHLGRDFVDVNCPNEYDLIKDKNILKEKFVHKETKGTCTGMEAFREYLVQRNEAHEPMVNFNDWIKQSSSPFIKEKDF